MKPPPARRAELDQVIANIELTLASIVQGLALQFLAESVGALLSRDKVFAWPYALVALLIILLFWSRALIHTLTLIRWPLEFVHNFFYFGCAMIEVLAFMQLTNPFRWFALNAGFAFCVWGLFIYDLRLIRLRAVDSVGPVGARLYATVEIEQWKNIRFLMPITFLYSAGAAFLVRANPGFWIDRHWHLLLIGGQFFGCLAYLIYVLRWFMRITPVISSTRAEWQDDTEQLED
jgi:hypothetical protein